MGYRVDTTATLVLEGMDGAEVDVLIGIPLAGIREWDDADSLVDEWAVFVRLAKPSWNLEDADGVIPADEAALDRLPPPVTRAIMREWRHATVNPPAPLRRQSSDTEP